MTITITAFEASPDRGRGQARDMRVRWALEEVGVPYEVRLVSFKEMKEPPHLALHPFGQIPTYEEGDLALFESGAIVLHIALHHPGLFPADPNARARAINWMFAAQSTVEPPIMDREAAHFTERDQEWNAKRQPIMDDRVRTRLRQLSARLGEADWLDGAFSAGDLVMVGVLRRLTTTGLLDAFPNLPAYVARGQARPAFQRAFDAQLKVFMDGRRGDAMNVSADAVDLLAMTYVLNRYFAALDEKTFDAETIGRFFSENAKVVRPNGSVTLGPVGIAESHAQNMGHFRATQHVMSNFIVTTQNDSGVDFRANLIAMHLWAAGEGDLTVGPNDNYFEAGGVISGHLVRSDDGWKISEIRNAVVWRRGVGFQQVLSRMK